MDKWAHPVIYALFFISVIFYAFLKKNGNNHSLLCSRFMAVLIVLGALCDIMENLRHSSIQFEPTLEASDEVLFEACVFASAKWILVNGVATWLFWQFSTQQQQPKQKEERDCKKQKLIDSFDASWIGPRPEDFLNTPVEAAGLLDVQGNKLPWTLSAPDGASDPERSYVVSSFGHFIGYAGDEARIAFSNNSPFMEILALTIIRAAGFLFHLLSFDDTVHFNNLFLSTNLWPNNIDWSQKQVESINKTLIARARRSPLQKDRAIVWRSVDPLSQPRLTEVLSNVRGCMMLPARIVNWSDHSEVGYDMVKELYQRKDLKRDIKLFQEKVGWDVVNRTDSPGYENAMYEMVHLQELTEEDATRIVDLFNQLYLDKYSRRNPQLTPKGIKRMVASGFLTVDVLRERKQNGATVGFSAASTTDGVRTASFIGYDIINDQNKEFYRLVMMLGHCSLIRDGVAKMHHSGGANEFKRHRGATSTVEYCAVFIDHLPIYRQLPWKLATAVADKVISVRNAR